MQDFHDPTVTALDGFGTVLAMSESGVRCVNTRQQYTFIYRSLYDEVCENEDYGNNYY